MTHRIAPFQGDELELVMDSLGNLDSINFFRRLADQKSTDFLARFDSIPSAEKSIEIERLAAQRAVLLNLAEEAAGAARARTSSTFQETLNETSVD